MPVNNACWIWVTVKCKFSTILSHNCQALNASEIDALIIRQSYADQFSLSYIHPAFSFKQVFIQIQFKLGIMRSISLILSLNLKKNFDLSGKVDQVPYFVQDFFTTVIDVNVTTYSELLYQFNCIKKIECKWFEF